MKVIKILIIIILIIFIASGLYIKLEVRHINIRDKRIKNNIKIAVLADFHGDKKDIVSKIGDVDFAVIPGDTFDEDVDEKNSYDFIKEVASKYKTYITIGNHDLRTKKFDERINKIKEINNVKLLDGNIINTNIKNTHIILMGLTDPENNLNSFYKQLNDLKDFKSDIYTILISHRPEKVNDYQMIDTDLIITGHAHGGQVRIPYILENGLYSPHQGFFPKYTNGLYQINKKQKMIVSRGLVGNNTFVPRFYNRPEIIILNIEKEEN